MAFRIVLVLMIVLGSGWLDGSLCRAEPSREEQRNLDRLAGRIDGSIVFTHRNRIHRVDIGDWKPVELGPGGFARWSPDGKRLAVWHDRRVYVMDADGGNRRELLRGADQMHDSPIAFHPDNEHIVYLIRNRGLHLVNIETGSTRSMDLPGQYTGEVGISADGKRLAARWRNDLYAVDLTNNTHRRYARGCSPGVSPDGTMIMNNVGGHRALEIRRWNGNRIKQLSADDARPDQRWDNHHWSNHADFIAAEGDGRQGEIYLVQVSNNDVFRVTWLGKCAHPSLFVRGQDQSVAARRDEAEQADDRQDNWPLHRENLAFAWRTIAQDNELYSPRGERIGTCRIESTGYAYYGRHHDMVLQRGRFSIETSGLPIHQTASRRGGITLAMPGRRSSRSVSAAAT
ncbi:MAG: PD40 domain-containing protein [Phycisphaeraceae bacterium]|nr:PD40 domain-containing protein [Phycisphaeraceae bacterium]